MEHLIMDIYPANWIDKYGGNVKIRQHDMKYGIIVARRDPHLVLRASGGMVWAGRGKQEYSPARYTTYKILGQEKQNDSKCIESISVEFLIDFTVPRKSSKNRIPKNQLSWEEIP